ncbi:hypothetical protein [Mycolicibacterium wolinskyi]|nr:hypothetical protein [Mycolicibacterium wolinskyi]
MRLGVAVLVTSRHDSLRLELQDVIDAATGATVAEDREQMERLAAEVIPA